jgi:hypothetical protein
VGKVSGSVLVVNKTGYTGTMNTPWIIKGQGRAMILRRHQHPALRPRRDKLSFKAADQFV